MSTVAYITALTIGISLATITQSQAMSTKQMIHTNYKMKAAIYAVDAKYGIDPLDKYRGKKKLTSPELIDLLKLIGFNGTGLKLAWAITMRESGGHPTSYNGNIKTGDSSYGLFQINMLGGLGTIRRDKFDILTNAELLDPVENAKAAYYMSNKGTNFGSWGLGPNAYDGTPQEPEVTAWLPKFPSGSK